MLAGVGREHLVGPLDRPAPAVGVALDQLGSQPGHGPGAERVVLDDRLVGHARATPRRTATRTPVRSLPAVQWTIDRVGRRSLATDRGCGRSGGAASSAIVLVLARPASPGHVEGSGSGTLSSRGTWWKADRDLLDREPAALELGAGPQVDDRGHPQLAHDAAVRARSAAERPSARKGCATGRAGRRPVSVAAEVPEVDRPLERDVAVEGPASEATRTECPGTGLRAPEGCD